MNKTLESLQSKKFDSKSLMGISGGETTYGPWRETRYDGFGGQDGDTAATTYNPPNYPSGTQGTDYLPKKQ